MSFRVVILLLICFLSAIGTNIHGNEYDFFDPLTYSQQVPTKADNMHIGKDISVDYYTGKANINIPIYTLESFDNKHSISLAYRSGGFVTDQEDGYLGYDWNLIAGYEITRTIVGLPDEMNGSARGFNHLTATEKSFIESLTQFNDVYGIEAYSEHLLIVPDSIRMAAHNLQDSYMKGHFDSGPDIYHFSFADGNGIFTCTDSIRNIQSSCFVDIQRINNENYDVFLLRDNRGYLYYFDEIETHVFKYRYNQDPRLISPTIELTAPYQYTYACTWKISKIISPCNDTITFNYISHSKTDPLFNYYKENITSIALYLTPFLLNGAPYTKSWQTTDGLRFAHFDNNEVYCRKLLTSISAANIKAELVYDTTGNKIPKLSSIAIKRRSIRNQGSTPIYTWQTLRTYQFLYNIVNDFFQQPNIYQLSEIRWFGKSSNNFRKWHISYYPISMFAHFSQYKDHWGFGKEYASVFATENYTFNNHNNIANRIFENRMYADNLFGSRTADSVNYKDGCLKTIEYPNGMKVGFDWEQHTYSIKSKTFIRTPYKAQPFFDSREEQVSNFTNIYHSLTPKNDTCTFTSAIGNTIIIDATSFYNYTASTNYECDDRNLPSETMCYCVAGWSNNQPNISDSVPYLKIEHNGQESRYYLNRDFYENDAGIISISVNDNHPYLFTLRLPDEQKELYRKGTSNELYCYQLYSGIDLTHYEYAGTRKIRIIHQKPLNNSNTCNTRAAGGVRIKSITYETNSTDKITKRYNYSLDPTSPESESSGVLALAPEYDSYAFIANPDAEDNALTMGYSNASYIFMLPDMQFMTRYRVCANGLPQTLTYTPHIEYGKVTELIGDSQENINPAGQTVYQLRNSTLEATTYVFQTSADEYTFDEMDTKHFYCVPTNQTYLTSHACRRGFLKTKIEYKEYLTQTNYDYSIYEKQNSDYIPATIITLSDCSPRPTIQLNSEDKTRLGFDYRPSDFGIVRYRIIPYIRNLQHIEEKYNDNNTNKATTYTYAHTEYNSWSANLPTSETVATAQGDTITTFYTYTYASCCNGSKAALISSKIISANGIITFAERYEYRNGLLYKTYTFAPDITTPATSNYNIHPSLNIYSEIEILTPTLKEERNYDTHNKLIEIINHLTGISTSFIWGYNGEYIVARLQNCPYAEIISEIGQTRIDEIYYSMIDIVTTNYWDLFPQALVTQYSYHMKEGMKYIVLPNKNKTRYFFNNYSELSVVSNDLGENTQTIEEYEYHYVY